MCWTFPLKLLQLVAACLGGSGVAAVCRALAVNFKHFSGGAPDLLLVRVTRETHSLLAEKTKEFVGLDVLLGPDWASLGAAGDRTSLGEGGAEWNNLSSSDASGTGKRPRTTSKPRGRRPLADEEGRKDGSEGGDGAAGGVDAVKTRPDPFECREESLDLSLLRRDGAELRLEAFLVEVKGPSDHLAYRQRLWLEVLSQATKAAVCFVRES
jgi:hypothetical protein